ncbi:putative damage-inducible protein DinB [Chitinophaga sp. W3I9]|uniref:DinB family protein n=1 Tax=unclassified Chitinophaga TaxID=2619133 RepID=UPI003D262275
MVSLPKIVTFLTFHLIIATACLGQQSITAAIERQFDKIENDILTTAEAMPESKYNFTPEDLHIKNSVFKGARTFGGQIMHLATDNILIWSAITGDSIRPDIEDVNGPKSITTKKDILDYLKASFKTGRKAISTLTDQNAMDMIDFRWRKLSRLDLAFYALTHANEHYGQMAIYLRMCGIVPPATANEK